jgi:hypothetical protein
MIKSAVVSVAVVAWCCAAQAGLSQDVEVYCGSSDCGTFNTWRICTTKTQDGFAFDLACLNRVMKRIAPPKKTEACSGTLIRDHGDLLFKNGTEGICIVNKMDEGRLLSTCMIGQRCQAIGTVNPCKDSGECAEISNIVSAKRR